MFCLFIKYSKIKINKIKRTLYGNIPIISFLVLLFVNRPAVMTYLYSVKKIHRCLCCGSTDASHSVLRTKTRCRYNNLVHFSTLRVWNSKKQLNKPLSAFTSQINVLPSYSWITLFTFYIYRTSLTIYKLYIGPDSFPGTIHKTEYWF